MLRVIYNKKETQYWVAHYGIKNNIPAKEYALNKDVVAGLQPAVWQYTNKGCEELFGTSHLDVNIIEDDWYNKYNKRQKQGYQRRCRNANNGNFFAAEKFFRHIAVKQIEIGGEETFHAVYHEGVFLVFVSIDGIFPESVFEDSVRETHSADCNFLLDDVF